MFGHSNSLCVRVLRAITNHALIGEYRLRFFPREEFKCLCGVYSIESRRHILYDCSRFNSYWNLRRDSLSHFVMFLKANPNTFAFLDNTYTTSISRSYSYSSSCSCASIVCSYESSYHGLPLYSV